MEYRIKEIAGMLNLSKQMIRYYEQCGVITPNRENNNYRIYDTMDYFALSEAIALSRFNVNIKDIYELKAIDYCNELSNCYRKYIDDTKKEIEYKALLKERAEELLSRVENAELNVGNIWVKHISAYRLYPLMKSHNDNYGKLETPKEIQKILSSSDVLPFCDGMFECKDNSEQWWLSIQKKYADALNLPIYDEVIETKDQYCLCVILNMG